MKKNFIIMLAVASALCMSCLSCNDKDAKKEDAKVSKKIEKVKANLPNYRYVDLDSVLSRYNLAKDYNEQMLSMQNNFDNAARQKENQINNEAARLQKKYQNNFTATQDEMAADQQRLAGLQQRAQSEMANMQNNIQSQALKYQKEVNDSIEKFIEIYNARHGYDAIFFKAATLYINPALDITDEVVEGLNARYNKKK